MGKNGERRLLQLAVALACLVPLSAGGAGAVEGADMIGAGLNSDPALDSHFRYLSGLLLGIGIAFAACIPTIERRSELFLALSAIVIVGGLARLFGLLIGGLPTDPHILALAMELGVMPLLLAWQRRIARLFRV